MAEADEYTKTFNLLKKRNEQANPFRVLTHIEYEVQITQIQRWEDLVTGEKLFDKKVVHTANHHQTMWNPFTNKGPYFLNSIGQMIQKFRKFNETGEWVGN